jgi:phage-related tail fiber protein
VLYYVYTIKYKYRYKSKFNFNQCVRCIYGTKNFATNASNLSSGTIASTVLPAFTGDATSTAGTSALTLAASGVTSGTYNNTGTTTTPFTVDAKGRITSTGTAVTITPAFSNITGLPTTLSGYGITNAQTLNANLTSVSGLSTSTTGLVKFTNGVASLDTSAYLTANQSISVTGDATGSGTTSIALTLANSGATAGTYKSVTVDAKGRVTAGTNPTTLAGYGITDAVSSSLLGAVSGIATLDSGGKVPSSQLPSYVDDVLDYTNLAAFPATGVTGIIYVADDTNKTYRWTGSVYIEISASPGSTDSVAEGTTNLYFTAARAQAAVTTITGNAATATSAAKLTTARNISATGDATWTVSFDGSADSTATLTLAASGATAGTYKSVTVDAKGRVTAGTNPTTLAGYGITDALGAASPALTGTPTTPTATASTNTTQIASTAFVHSITQNASDIYVVDTGTANTYVATYSPAVTTLVDGMILSFRAINANTSASTLNVNGLGAKPIVGAAHSALQGGEIIAGSYCDVKYSSSLTSFVLMMASGGAEQVTTPTQSLHAVNKSYANNASNLSTGTVSNTLLPAFTGDATSTAGTSALTLATVATAGTYRSVTIDVKGRVTAGTNPTTLAGYGITDALSSSWTGSTSLVTAGALTATSLSSSGNISMNQSSIVNATLTTSTTTANQVVTTISSSTYRTVKVLVQCTSGTSYHSSEIIAIHDGTTVYINEYGTVYSASLLATYDMDISGGNLRLLVTPVNAASTIKAYITACTL